MFDLKCINICVILIFSFEIKMLKTFKLILISFYFINPLTLSSVDPCEAGRGYQMQSKNNKKGLLSHETSNESFSLNSSKRSNTSFFGAPILPSSPSLNTPWEYEGSKKLQIQ